MEQEQKPRELGFLRELVPAWRPTGEQLLWMIRIVIVLVVVLGILTLVGLPFGITLWQWLDLLIIPFVLAIGGYLFTRSENRATRGAAEQRAQDEALQAYLRQIGELLLDTERPLRKSKEGDEARTLARARTLTALKRLDAEHNRSLLGFLSDSQLVGDPENPIIDFSKVDLHRAKLTGANFTGAVLDKADLSHADLSTANLKGAFLYKADLIMAALSGADLSGASLIDAALNEATLSLADLSGTDLSDAELRGANLYGANLLMANLRGADLGDADLTGARNVTEKQLAQCKSLEGATMPHGQKYEDWLKSRGGGEDGENE